MEKKHKERKPSTNSNHKGHEFSSKQDKKKKTEGQGKKPIIARGEKPTEDNKTRKLVEGKTTEITSIPAKDELVTAVDANPYSNRQDIPNIAERTIKNDEHGVVIEKTIIVSQEKSGETQRENLEEKTQNTIQIQVQATTQTDLQEVSQSKQQEPPLEKQQDTSSKKQKDKRPSSVSLKDKSELFKQIIDIALSCEKIESDNKRLKDKSKCLEEEKRHLLEERDELHKRLKEGDLLYRASQEQIAKLESDVEQREEVINVVKADKSETAQEFKNALAAALKTFFVDYRELKEMGTLDDIGLALIDTFEGVIKTLEKYGIIVA